MCVLFEQNPQKEGLVSAGQIRDSPNGIDSKVSMKVVFDNMSELKSRNNITPWYPMLFLWRSILKVALVHVF